MNIAERKVKKFTDACQAGERGGYSEAVRCKCLDCMGFNMSEVRKCPSKDCPLWYFRFGRNNTGKTGP